ncbi:MAG: ATP-grasp domain-containing protein [Deltaproteobacteria bacterium]|nr:ATP-grasp domain-containing protein [Deltaproteobacteria bacterium]
MMPKILIVCPLTENAIRRYVAAAKKLSLSPVLIVLVGETVAADILNSASVMYIEKLTNSPLELVEQCRNLAIKAVIAGGEFSVAATEFLASQLGLIRCMKGRPDVLRNKYTMRMAFQREGVDQPALLGVAGNMSEVDEVVRKITSYPIITKPADMAGSWFVSLNMTPEEIPANTKPIFEYKTSKVTGLEFAGLCVFEEFFEGDEYSAEVIVFESRILAMYFNKKLLSQLPYFDEIGHICGIALSDPLRNRLQKNIRGVLRAADVHNGILHVEFKLKDDKMVIIEVGCRIAGDKISNLVELKYGVNLEECMILIKSGVEPQLPTASNEYLYGIRFLFGDDKPISSANVQIVENAMEHGNLGTHNLQRTHISNRIGYQICKSRHYDELATTISSLGRVDI